MINHNLVIFSIIFLSTAGINLYSMDKSFKEGIDQRLTIADEACVIFNDHKKWLASTTQILDKSPYSEFTVTNFSPATGDNTYGYLVQPTGKWENLLVFIDDIETAYQKIDGVVFVGDLSTARKKFAHDNFLPSALTVIKRKALKNISTKTYISTKKDSGNQ